MSKKLLAGLAAATASVGSFAAVAAPDVSPVVTYIEGLAAPICTRPARRAAARVCWPAERYGHKLTCPVGTHARCACT